MRSSVVERASHLREVVESLAGLRDDTGVLSISIGIEPGAVLGGRPAWEIALENDLAGLSHDGVRRRAIERRLAGAATEMSRLLDPTLSGRGRALYIALGSGATTEIFLPTALTTAARMGQIAHLLPLLKALDEGEPAGFISASRDAISVSESDLGAVHDLEHLELEPWVGDWWPEMKAPARANPLHAQHTVSHRDRYARRVAAAYRHTFHEAVERISSLARRRGWTRAVVAGDARRAGALVEVLGRGGVVTTALDATLEGVRGVEASGRLREALGGLTARQALERTREAEAQATAGGKGACGLAHVLAALAEGRVARLLIDPSRSFPGAVGPRETLSAAVEAGSGIDLTDWIVAQALATDATVTAVHGEAAAVLEGRDGIGALLRW